MPNQRQPLSDKEERILVQAQLMGLTTASMVRIGNRLRALEREAEAQANINDNIAGYTWETPTKEVITVTTPDGYRVVARRSWGNRGGSYYHRNLYHNYDIEITKPGSRVKQRQIPEVNITMGNDWLKRMMPANSKALYGVIRWCNINLHRYLTK